MRLVTWNVLHRVHGVNWAEPCLEAWPDERLRQEHVARRVAGWLADGVDAVCLQEVSGDQLALLEALVLPGRCFSQRAPRLPTLRVKDAALGDSSEHLVLLTASPAVRIASDAFQNDPGKGFLAVRPSGGPCLVTTHVSHGAPGEVQLRLLAQLARQQTPAVVLGDFNAPVRDVVAGVGDGFVAADLSGQGPTRVATPSASSGKVIDHLLVHGGQVRAASVLPTEALSDHHPVIGEVG